MKDAVASGRARSLSHGSGLVLPGSTALDPARVMRIRARFTPAQVVSIAEVDEKDKLVDSMKTEKHELRPGDEVTPNMELGVFFSPDAGNKKNDLFEAIVQMRLDEVILKKAEESSGSLPEIYLWTARRNVDTDRSAVRRARNTLLTWGVEKKDIDEVVRRSRAAQHRRGTGARSFRRRRGPRSTTSGRRSSSRRPSSRATRPSSSSAMSPAVRLWWTTRSTCSRSPGSISCWCTPTARRTICRNWIGCGRPAKMRWTVQTVGHDPKEGVEGTITEIGWIIDPNQYTAIIKGFIPNPGGKIRAGQFANGDRRACCARRTWSRFPSARSSRTAGKASSSSRPTPRSTNT